LMAKPTTATATAANDNSLDIMNPPGLNWNVPLTQTENST
jgi:hypothetical protein